MKPPRAVLPKNLVPINVSRLQLRNGRMPAVITSQCRPYPKSAFRKIQPVARCPPHSIMFHPANQRLINTALVNQVLEQAPHRIIHKRRHYCRLQPEAALQSARHVVLSAALAHFKPSRRRNSSLARIEPHHHLAQAHQIPAALLFRLNRQRHSLSSKATTLRKFLSLFAPDFSIQSCRL